GAPRFVKRYAKLADEIRGALKTYADEVRTGAYPADEHTYSMPDEELRVFSQSSAAVDQAVDRSFQTDTRAKPARPEDGSASGAREGEAHPPRDGYRGGDAGGVRAACERPPPRPPGPRADPDHEQHERPAHERIEDPRGHGADAAPVGTAGTKEA